MKKTLLFYGQPGFDIALIFCYAFIISSFFIKTLEDVPHFKSIRLIIIFIVLSSHVLHIQHRNEK
ncbi:hypothetical protein [Enterococcus gallinarum]|uniref:hypothetical protein n=1 Tax=Enterococcus gallinarum TaxID=1353 RepID=UPI0012E1002D|nr:hypothetical protein [Enterococcus gallinarum]MUO33362.1 hypothetical protein [Enterococcus gallinarum]